MITLEQLTKVYRKTPAVNRLSLALRPGELFAFLGPNGAGKTTTIKLITGLLRPTSGSVQIGAYDLHRHPLEARRLIGFVPDRPFMYPRLSGWEFLHFVAEVHQVAPTAIAPRAEHWLELFGLADSAHELIESYSHGMKQKLALSAALIHDPQVLVIDEPMVGLDPRSARILKNLLRELTAAGKTVFLSTHTLDVAEELADRIGIIHHGELIALGAMAELRQQSRIADGRLEALFLQLTEPEGPGETAATPRLVGGVS